jgi:hypothetical protein
MWRRSFEAGEPTCTTFKNLEKQSTANAPISQSYAGWKWHPNQRCLNMLPISR